MVSLSSSALTAALFVGAVSTATAQNLVTLTVAIMTDDHPDETSWSLRDVCPGGKEVLSGGAYTLPGVLETTSTQAMASKYLFTIIDNGGDGICCSHGPKGYYKVLQNQALQLEGGDFTVWDGGYFGGCTTPTTSKPTNFVPGTPTYQPTPKTTLPPSEPENVSIKIDILFDDYPEDITWTLENICPGQTTTLGSGGPYDASLETKTVYSQMTPNGKFAFKIDDSFGDGLCCTAGKGGYTIYYDSMGVTPYISAFQEKSTETHTFGKDNNCKAASGGKATYSADFRAPTCTVVHPNGVCTTVDTGLLNCKKKSGEPNGPNTLDLCQDGPDGNCGVDESIQDITIMTTNGAKLFNGALVKIKTTIYSFGDGSEDQVDFYHTKNPGPNAVWTHLDSVKPKAGGRVEVESKTFDLPNYKVQGIRVNLRWVGKGTKPPKACSTGSGTGYNDVDDLVFTVDQKCELPQGSIKNCAKYYMENGKEMCYTCAKHYEVDPTGTMCTPCVVCPHPIDASKTLDFCPDLMNQWGGVIPHKDDGSYVLYPKIDNALCQKYVKWGPGGWDVENKPNYYCGNRDTRDPNQHIAWIYNISVTQEAASFIDGFEREVIMMKSGLDKEYKVPGRPVYACHNDTILAETVNAFPHHVEGAAYYEGCDKSIGCPSPNKNPGQKTNDIMGFTLHWHGMIQENNQFMDGVAMLSQCPIGNLDDNYIPCTSQYNDPDENTFTYSMLADPGGTYWFHSHTGLQYGDGLFASLIIYEPEVENPYHNDYEVDLHPIIMGDWWHALSQDLIVELYFGIADPWIFPGKPYPATGGGDTNPMTVDTVCPLNKVKCQQAFKPDSASAFNCLCAGGASDYPWKSGHMQGHGQYPEITQKTTAAEAKTQKFYEIDVKSGLRYRLRIVNGGFNFGLRFSIDDHKYTVIAADGQYLKKINDVSHFSVMPGERYDIIFQAKSGAELVAGGGDQYFIRATTYNHTYWKQNDTLGWEVAVEHKSHQIFAVLNYKPGTTKDNWFAAGAKLAMDLPKPSPPVTKVVDISFFYDQDEWNSFGRGGGTVELVQKLLGYREPLVKSCTGPFHDGSGPTGAPFGCNPDGSPLPIPEPDLLVHLWVNGIMYPAYNLFLAKSPVMDFKEAKMKVKWGQGEIERPNMYARPTVPLVYTRKDKSHYRYLDVWGPNSDSPAWNPDVNGTRYNWGSSLKENFGNATKDSNPFFAGAGHGITNNTMTIRLPVNKWVMVIQHNFGPMTHPFHIHGTDVYTLARDSDHNTKSKIVSPSATARMCRLDTGKGPWNNPYRVPQMLDPEDPICRFDGGNYVNGYGLDLIPPVSNRFGKNYMPADYDNQDVTNRVDPPTRDMPVVPPHGYVVWQWYTGNPGAWFYHCHLEFHAGLGMGVVWMIGDTEEEWLNGKMSAKQINAFNQANCRDVEFEGPLQFY